MKIRIACCDDEKQQLELYKTMFTNIEMRQDIKLNVEYFLSGNFMLERFQSEKNPFDFPGETVNDTEIPRESNVPMTV